jgi:hypothetical protein
MDKKKDDYKDIEEEAEREAYDKIRSIPDERSRRIQRDFEELIEMTKPFHRFEQWLFTRYCNANKLSEKQIDELWEDQRQKDLFNRKISFKSWKNPTIKSLSTRQEDPSCQVQTWNVMWTCMFPSCHALTPLLIVGNVGLWCLSVCPKHHEEFRTLVKLKPVYEW